MMKRVIAVLLALTLTLALGLSLTGCHGSKGMDPFAMPNVTTDENGETVIDPEYELEGEYELTFWAKNDTNLVQREIYNSAIENFEKLYPNIKITIRSYTDYASIYQDVITNIATNTTPNICITYPDHIATYLTGTNIMAPLDELIADPYYGLGGSKLKYDSPSVSEIVPQFLKECYIGDTLYAVPFMRSTEALYVNKDMVEALGYEMPEMFTWDLVWEISEKAMEQDADGNYKVNGQKVMIPFIYKSTDNMMIQSLKQLNGDYSTAEGDILIFNDTTKSVLESIAPHAESRAFSTFKISSYPGNFMNAGQCIFAVDSTAGATWIGGDAPLSDIAEDKKVNFETVVYPIPQYDTANPQMISQGPSLCIFNKSDPNEVLASWIFAQYLLTNEVQTAYAQTEGYVPVTTKAQETDSYKDYLSRRGEDNDAYYYVKIDASKLLLGNLANTFTTPVFNGSASLREAAGQMIENVAKSVRRGETVDDAYYEKLYSDITALYRLDQLDTTGKGGKSELGALPGGSKALIIVLVAVWLVLGGLTLFNKLRKKA